MSNLPFARPLPAIAPQPPNFHFCHAHYGENLKFGECNSAGSAILHYTLPVSFQYRGCIVAVERAGPEATPPFVIDRDVVRGMIGWVISQCVTPSGIGGFVTASFERMVNHIIDPLTEFTESLPPYTAFLTVTVAGQPNYMETKTIAPGDYDPAIPEALSGALRGVISGWRSGNSYASHYIEGAWILELIASDMDRDSPNTLWWDSLRKTPTATQMAYECDPKLGSPTVVDCSKLEYSSLLGAPSDSISVGPGSDQFFSLGTCSVAITASVSLRLTWSQIKIALDTLINLCVSNPTKPALGGRAYYDSLSSHSLGRYRTKRGTLDGLNALPPHANITINGSFPGS